MIKIAINGASGRMGRRLVALATEEPDMQVVAALESPGHPDLGTDAGELAGIGAIGVALSDSWEVDSVVLIDFTAPAGTLARLDEAIAKNCALMIGTTGCTDAEKETITQAGKSVPLIHAQNTSVGVNLLFKLVGQVAAALGEEYDIEIVEGHHRFKKDSPSGTAVGLAERICAATDRDYNKDVIHGRQGIIGARTKKEIGMHAVRAGDIVGDHTVTYCALGERIEITHRAHTRDTFVRGALRAARYLTTKEPGIYGMSDVLGI